MPMTEAQVTAQRRRATRHGHCPRGTPTRTYRIWKKMRARCNEVRSVSYSRYGGRGITVCPRWDKFEAFLADMGECPPGLQIDRVDNGGNYEPGNCRWATRIEQANNRRSSRFLTVNGVRLTVSQWARVNGIHRSTIFGRLRRGWAHDRAVQ